VPVPGFGVFFLFEVALELNLPAEDAPWNSRPHGTVWL
jgi:hypothetical protein